MAEYYPLLAKAVGSLPNSTLDSRRVVYERARKALIGQLRMLHPPVPDEDIDRESVELDRAIERLESELARGGGQLPPSVKPAPQDPGAPPPTAKPPAALRPAPPPRMGAVPVPPLRTSPPRPGATASGSAEPASLPKSPPFPVRPRPPLNAAPDVVGGAGGTATALKRADAAVPVAAAASAAALAKPPPDPLPARADRDVALATESEAPGEANGRVRFDGQRPIAPQAPARDGARRRMWIVPVGIALIVAVVAVAAYALRDKRETVARNQPTEPATKSENGKIAERVGGDRTSSPRSSGSSDATSTGAPSTSPRPTTPTASVPFANPEVPVAQRAALLIEAPDEPNKVKTFLGTVVWKLSNVNDGPGDNVSLAVEADIDLPDDKMKAVVTFEKNTDASLPASHTIKVRFSMQPGSLSGDIQQISVPQLRQEDSPSGEALAGVTVPVVANSFLVGLSPGNAESVNIKQLRDRQWIDVPMLLASGKIAKLTFEKGASGDRDLGEAITAWQKS